MGSNNKPVERKRKKKGRPSLLDLQKRNLRLQKQQQEQQKRNPNPNPSPNPYLRFPNPASGRRITRRNPNSGDLDDDDDDDDDDEDCRGNRREKKLKLVLRLPHSPGSGSHGGSGGEREIENGGGIKAERGSSSKATDPLREKPSDCEPLTTRLPDEKLLVFILDRLQKKDTYGVYSEPVDPKELPDYHEVVEHPMDFGTVRKKLSSGVYANLEEFEEDVYLISSNAMLYNATDTIYYRQARAIQELAKKSFENLRQESDDNEPEPKTVVRRGRPPTKKTPEQAASDLSGAMLPNAGDGPHWSNPTQDLSRRGLAPGAGVSTRASLGLRNIETFSWSGENKAVKNEEYSGSVQKGFQTRFGRKPIVVDESRRNTYKQPHTSIDARQTPFLFIDGEQQQLMPIGLHMEHSYARSLARFAANLGPVGWAIAAKKIERALPHGTNFGRGWIRDSAAPQQSHPPLLSSSPPHPSSLPQILPCSTIPRGGKLPQMTEMPSTAPASVSNRSPDSMEGTEPAKEPNREAGGDSSNNRIQRVLGMQPVANGYSPQFGFSLASQLGKAVRPSMISRRNDGFALQSPASQLDPERSKSSGGCSSFSNSVGQDPQMGWRGSSLQQNPDSVPPDLNVRFQSPGSPTTGLVVDPQQQQHDISLQL